MMLSPLAAAQTPAPHVPSPAGSRPFIFGYWRVAFACGDVAYSGHLAVTSYRDGALGAGGSLTRKTADGATESGRFSLSGSFTSATAFTMQSDGETPRNENGIAMPPMTGEAKDDDMSASLAAPDCGMLTAKRTDPDELFRDAPAFPLRVKPPKAKPG